MSKIKYDSLQDILDFIRSTHRHLQSTAGIYCLRLYRNADGLRVPFEEFRGVRIKNFEIYDLLVIITTQRPYALICGLNFIPV